jgi:hypothetical protein
MFLEFWVLPGGAVLLFLGMLALQELSRRLGSQQARADDGGSAGRGEIDAAVFALLGLILAFQFNGAAARLEIRRAQLLQEANAIGTAYMRLDFLPLDDQSPIRALFRRYLDARITVYQAIPDMVKIRTHQRQAVALQSEIWTAVVNACDRKPVPGVNVLIFPALNEMIDITTTRDTTALTHAPWLTTAFLFAICLLAASVAGRAMARAAERPLFHMIAFAAIAAATVYVILDLDYPRIGLIRIGVTERALLDLRPSMWSPAAGIGGTAEQATL